MIKHFISDLHLSKDQPHLEKLFFFYMKEMAPRADELFVLGDLFDSWIGDDDDSFLAQEVTRAFREFSESPDKSLYFMHGNRDFLLGEQFETKTGGKLLAEGSRLNVAGQSTLLMHGDSLCIDDVDYQKFREMVRSPIWQQQMLSQSLPARRKLAENLRTRSRDAIKIKDDMIMDVNKDEVDRVMREADVELLIHGHTHRPDHHSFTVDDKVKQRIVLGDWGSKGHVLIADDDKIESVWFEIPDKVA